MISYLNNTKKLPLLSLEAMISSQVCEKKFHKNGQNGTVQNRTVVLARDYYSVGPQMN